MARFLLVHGAGHGAWCWRETVPVLQALGHDTAAIDLPSHGDDPTPVEQVTLDSYAKAIHDALDEPAIVVGHSMAGYPITLAAEQNPDRIQGLVYLCAYTPWPDATLTQMRLKAPYQPLLPAIQVSQDRTFWTFDTDQARDVLYHDCSDAQIAFATARLTAQAIQPSETPVPLTRNSQGLPRAYVICEQDGAIPPEFQVTMAARFKPENTYRLPTSHSPFFSAPKDLAAILHDFATRETP